MIVTIDSTPIRYLCINDSIIRDIILKYGDLKYELYNNYYEFIVYTIVSQMLSNKIGHELFNRILELVGGKISPDSIYHVGIEKLKASGISTRKANAIFNLTKYSITNPSYLAELTKYNDSEIIDSLTKIKGIGPWTVKMFLIFCLDRKDVLPTEDGAFITAFKLAYNFKDDTRDKRYIKEYCTKWKPYSSYAVRYIYKAFDAGLI